MADANPAQLPVVVRSLVPARSDYEDYRPELRIDFWFACAYCSIAEIEASGISFEIDHYLPRENHKELAHTYENLMYSCRLCNRIKHDEEPDDKMLAKGIRFFRPDQDDPDAHFEIRSIVDIYPLTPVGEYTVEGIRLHREQLKKLRQRRHRLYQSKEVTLKGRQALQRMGLDRFPPHLRLEVLGLKREIEAQAQTALDNLDEVLKQLNRSPNVDPDTKQSTKRRRDYLKKVHAPVPQIDE